jgi:glycosyltransferase involved in cell wall biosynthesis
MERKILIFSVAYLPYVGGAELAVKEITDRIKDARFDMITARMDKKLAPFEKIGNINVYRIGFGLRRADKYIFTFFGFLKALKLHFKNHYQVIWPIMAAYSSFSVLFKICFPKTRLILTLQEGDPIEYIVGLKRFKIFWPVYKLYFRSVDKAQAISNYLADWAESLGIKKDKIEVVPNAVDTGRFSRDISESDLDEIIVRLGKKPGEKLIITVSRLVEKNAVDDVIRCLSYLPENIKFLVLGAGPEENNLRRLAQELKVSERVLFCGQIGHKDLPKYLKISDVFVRPSLSEGLGNSFLEAMAAGVPVIGTNVGGIPDFIKEGETGLFCEVKNPKSIAEKINILFSDNALRQKLTENGKKLVAEKYDWDLVSKKMENIFNKLIKE